MPLARSRSSGWVTSSQPNASPVAFGLPGEVVPALAEEGAVACGVGDPNHDRGRCRPSGETGLRSGRRASSTCIRSVISSQTVLMPMTRWPSFNGKKAFLTRPAPLRQAGLRFNREFRHSAGVLPFRMTGYSRASAVSASFWQQFSHGAP